MQHAALSDCHTARLPALDVETGIYDDEACPLQAQVSEAC